MPLQPGLLALALFFSPLQAASTSDWALPLAGLPGAAVSLPAPVPAPGVLRGDFTALPAYAFGYLNDLNTRLIDASRRSVDAALFSITLKDNPDALLRAKNRGVRVRVIMDEQHVYPRADAQVKRLMSEPGIEFRTLRGTRSYGVNHNKILLCDGAAAAIGSYNWTFGATFSNFENTLVARQPVYTEGYGRYFDWMWSAARTPQQGPSPELPEGYYGQPPQDPAPSQSLNGLPVPAYLFSPGSATEERLARIIDAAAVSVDAVTFTFSSRILADAVVRARQRGVRVRFLMDTNMAKTSALAKQVFDSGAGFRWRIGRTDKGALHNKFVILDGRLLATGSFNWTVNASKNSFENLAFVSDAEVVRAYQDNFDSLYESSAVPAAGDFQAEPYGD
ncbi:MAG: hypothetical protein A2089_08675 [Elusimicrobia bacterium GWD2_63_28]|nr:MAG: hypothetical protein A2089_08675 [Elusimicrobia bacterium GWD2_63_28]